MSMATNQRGLNRGQLDECGATQTDIQKLSDLTTKLEAAQRRVLLDAGSGQDSELKRMRTELLFKSRELSARVQALRRRPEANLSTYEGHIELCRSKLQEALRRLTAVERSHEQAVREQAARQYRIVAPEASDAEVQAAVEQGQAQGQQQIFAQALRDVDRRGQTATVLAEVQDRHIQIQAAEHQLEQLGSLFKQLDELVGKQDFAVVDIETSAADALDNVQRAGRELDSANRFAAALRRHKWICFWITVAIILIVGLVIGVAIPCGVLGLCHAKS